MFSWDIREEGSFFSIFFSYFFPYLKRGKVLTVLSGSEKSPPEMK